jgi:hypothetical protein
MRRADDLGSQHAVSDPPQTSSNHEWSRQQQDPATEGAGSAGMLPVFGALSMIRAADNSIPPHQGYVGPSVPLMGPQIHNLGYPNRQGKHAHLTRGAPPLAPQLGTADTESYVRHSGQGVADMLSHNIWPDAFFNGYGASPLEISEGAGSGGAGAFTSIECVGGLNGGDWGSWATSTAAAGEYNVRQDFTHGVGAQPNGVRGAFKFRYWS